MTLLSEVCREKNEARTSPNFVSKNKKETWLLHSLCGRHQIVFVPLMNKKCKLNVTGLKWAGSTHPWGDDDWLESLENWFDGYRRVHAAERGTDKHTDLWYTDINLASPFVLKRFV